MESVKLENVLELEKLLLLLIYLNREFLQLLLLLFTQGKLLLPALTDQWVEEELVRTKVVLVGTGALELILALSQTIVLSSVGVTSVSSQCGILSTLLSPFAFVSSSSREVAVDFCSSTSFSSK